VKSPAETEEKKVKGRFGLWESARMRGGGQSRFSGVKSGRSSLKRIVGGGSPTSLYGDSKGPTDRRKTYDFVGPIRWGEGEITSQVRASGFPWGRAIVRCNGNH